MRDLFHLKTFMAALYTTLPMHYMNGMKKPELQCRPQFVIICISYELSRTWSMIRLYLCDRVWHCQSVCITHNFVDRLRLSMGKYSDLALTKVSWGNNFQLNFSSNHKRNDFKQVVLDPLWHISLSPMPILLIQL